MYSLHVCSILNTNILFLHCNHILCKNHFVDKCIWLNSLCRTLELEVSVFISKIFITAFRMIAFSVMKLSKNKSTIFLVKLQEVKKLNIYRLSIIYIRLICACHFNWQYFLNWNKSFWLRRSIHVCLLTYDRVILNIKCACFKQVILKWLQSAWKAHKSYRVKWRLATDLKRRCQPLHWSKISGMHETWQPPLKLLIQWIDNLEQN